MDYYKEYFILFTSPKFDITSAVDLVPAWLGEKITASRNAMMENNNEITINTEDLDWINEQLGGVLPNNTANTLKEALSMMTNESMAKKLESEFVNK